jgi:hypothetical protein
MDECACGREPACRGHACSNKHRILGPGRIHCGWLRGDFQRRRLTELMRGRVSMLATMGYITPEVTGKLPSLCLLPHGVVPMLSLSWSTRGVRQDLRHLLHSWMSTARSTSTSPLEYGIVFDIHFLVSS